MKKAAKQPARTAAAATPRPLPKRCNKPPQPQEYFVLTPEQIREECAKIRAGWTSAELRLRIAGKPD